MPQALDKHIACFHMEKLYECDAEGCGIKFGLKERLEEHKKTVHEKIKKFLCTYCGKSYPYRASYIRHLRIHTNEKPFVCQFCEKAFTYKYSLQEHLHIHTGEKPRKCRFCDKCFRTREPQRRHERTHTKFLPFQCKFCETLFADMRPLKRHVLSFHEEDCSFNLEIPDTFRLLRNKKDPPSHDSTLDNSQSPSCYE